MRLSNSIFVLLLSFVMFFTVSCSKTKDNTTALIEQNITEWLSKNTTKKSRLVYDSKTDIYNIIYVSKYTSSLNLDIEAIKTGDVDYEDTISQLDWDSTKDNLNDLTKNVINQLKEFGVKEPNVVLSFYDKTQNNCYLKFSNDGLVYDKFDEVK